MNRWAPQLCATVGFICATAFTTFLAWLAGGLINRFVERTNHG